MQFYPHPETERVQDVINRTIQDYAKTSRKIGMEFVERDHLAIPDINDIVGYMHNGGGAPLPGSETHSMITFPFVKPLWTQEGLVGVGAAAEVELFFMDRMAKAAEISDAEAYNAATMELLSILPTPDKDKRYSLIDGVPVRITPIPITFAQEGILNRAAFANKTEEIQTRVQDLDGRACIIFNPRATMLNLVMPTLIKTMSKVSSTQITHLQGILESQAQQKFMDHVLVMGQ